MSDKLFEDDPLEPIQRKPLWLRIVNLFTESKDKGIGAVKLVGNHIEVSIKKIAESKTGQETLRGIQKIRERQKEEERSSAFGLTSNKDYYRTLVKKYNQSSNYYKSKNSGLDPKTIEAIRKIQRTEMNKIFK